MKKNKKVKLNSSNNKKFKQMKNKSSIDMSSASFHFGENLNNEAKSSE